MIKIILSVILILIISYRCMFSCPPEPGNNNNEIDAIKDSINIKVPLIAGWIREIMTINNILLKCS